MHRPTVDTTRYIAFEGVEGAGKSTIAQSVGRYLEARGERVTQVREPGGTHVGEAVREIVLGDDHDPLPRSEAALFAAARAQLVADVVVPRLEEGGWVISDRSAYSSLAYQSGGRGIPLDEVRTLNDIAINGVWPGTVVLLRLNHEEGLGRQDVGDRIGSEKDAFHEAVAEAFDALAAAEPDRFVVVDASAELESVLSAVVERLGIPS